MGITCHRFFTATDCGFISKSSGYLKYKLLIEKNLINDENCVKNMFVTVILHNYV